MYLILAAVILLTVPVQLWLRRQALDAHKEGTAAMLGLTAIGTVGAAVTLGFNGSWFRLVATAIMAAAIFLLYRQRTHAR